MSSAPAPKKTLLEEIVSDNALVAKIKGAALGTPQSVEDTKAWLKTLRA